jgi:hypothetical protein
MTARDAARLGRTAGALTAGYVAAALSVLGPFGLSVYSGAVAAILGVVTWMAVAWSFTDTQRPPGTRFRDGADPWGGLPRPPGDAGA